MAKQVKRIALTNYLLMEPRADLHIHSTASDGMLTPTQVVEAAAQAGLAAVALTDHDTVAGIDEALAAGTRLGVEVVPAIEISSTHAERVEVHILGYFFDYKAPDLVDRLEFLRNARWERAKQIVEKLNAVGVPVEFDRVVEIARGGAIGRPHVARAICEVGAAGSIDSAFGHFLIEGCPAYVPRYKVTPFEAIDMIIATGGVAGCAHVAKLKRDELLVEMIKHGLRAIEVRHPDHSSVGRKFYTRFAKTRGLIATGGSDAHYFGSENRPGIGDVTVPYEIVSQLKQASHGA
ncbi:MAG: PHP domain-containing protein [Armatimonadota bacterium]